MPRKRQLHVAESLDELSRLELRAGTATHRLRITALRILKEDPGLTTAELARRLGKPARTVKRWIAIYRERGLDGILSSGAHCDRISADIADEVGRLLLSGEFSTVADVKSWLKIEHDISASLPTVASLLRRCSCIPVEHVVDVSFKRSRVDASVDLEIANWLYGYLRSLPDQYTSRQWIETLQQSLATFLSVDRVCIALNLQALEPKPQDVSHSISIREVINATESAHGPAVSVKSIDSRSSRGAQFIAQMIEHGFKADLYHQPLVEEYMTSDDTYVGTIVIWQERHRPLDDTPATTVTKMKPLLVRLMLDCAAHHQCARPSHRHFYDVLAHAVVEYHLTPSEEQVLTMQLLGLGYKAIAASMRSTVENVGKHLSSVHKKTRTNGIAELTALLFSPRVG